MIYIYKYENNLNHKIYIGQTVDFKKRCREHLNASINKNHRDYNFPIHRAINIYGINNFTITVIDCCNSKEKANERERYWIKKYNSYQNGYNATPGGQDGGGYNGKQVDIYDLNGNYLMSYENAKIAAKELGISYSSLMQVIHNKRTTCKNIQAKFHNDNRKISQFHSRQGGKIPIYQINKDTNNIIKEWESATYAAKVLNLDSSSITKCLKGKLKTHGGFKWRYKECDTQE